MHAKQRLELENIYKSIYSKAKTQMRKFIQFLCSSIESNC